MSKINSIKFNNYRAFYGEFPEIKLDGKNLLVWGENGSGKSSFCKALHDFVFGKINDSHQKNKFSADDWSINFNVAGTNYTFEQTSAITNIKIKNCALASPFLDYRKILSLYFSSDSEGKELNLFAVFEKLLAEYPVIQKEGRKLKELSFSPDYKDVFSSILNLELKDEIINILEIFNLKTNIESFEFYYDEASDATINDDVSDSGAGFSDGIGYGGGSAPGSGAADGTGWGVNFDNRKMRIKIKTSIFGEEITERYHEFLNEARLSALSISVYLAAIKKLTELQPEMLNILVLDDMLIGLDMGNRIAVFDILKKHFKDSQVFFFTYDKAWFEVFRDKVDDEEWISFEMYAQFVDVNSKNFEVPFIKEKKDYWIRSIEELSQFNYDNCGNLLRKELEKQLDKYLAISDGKLEQKIFLADLKEREQKISTTLNALFSKIENIKAEITDQPFLGKMNSIESSIRDIKEAEKNKMFAYLKEIKDTLLNPSSHNQTHKPFYKRELEQALDAIVEFMKNNNIEIDLPSAREKVLKSIKESVIKETVKEEPTKLLTEDDEERLRNFDEEVDDDFQRNP